VKVKGSQTPQNKKAVDQNIHSFPNHPLQMEKSLPVEMTRTARDLNYPFIQLERDVK
jgi:hypothetical protein